MKSNSKNYLIYFENGKYKKQVIDFKEIYPYWTASIAIPKPAEIIAMIINGKNKENYESGWLTHSLRVSYETSEVYESAQRDWQLKHLTQMKSQRQEDWLTLTNLMYQRACQMAYSYRINNQKACAEWLEKSISLHHKQ